MHLSCCAWICTKSQVRLFFGLPTVKLFYLILFQHNLIVLYKSKNVTKSRNVTFLSAPHFMLVEGRDMRRNILFKVNGSKPINRRLDSHDMAVLLQIRHNFNGVLFLMNSNTFSHRWQFVTSEFYCIYVAVAFERV